MSNPPLNSTPCDYKRIERALHDSQQRVIEMRSALVAARQWIEADRDSLVECHTRASTGEIDTECRDGVADYDAVLAVIDGALKVPA